MSTPSRFPLLAAGVSGATGVGLGAFGAHALRATLLELQTRDRWETAVVYQLVHTVALVGAAAWLRTAQGTEVNRMVWAARFWVAGIVLFSGGLYILSLTTNAPTWFKAAVPPVGGTCFLIGWLCTIAASAVKKA